MHFTDIASYKYSCMCNRPYLHTSYRKQQKLSGRKVLQFNGFYHNVGKTFTVHQVHIGTQNGTYKLIGKTFAVS